MNEAVIENGFARVGSGVWLVGTAQPAAVLGNCVPRPLKGLFVPDRAKVHLIQVDGMAACSDAERPFLTRIPCAAPLTIVSSKLLVAPQEAREKGGSIRIIPYNFCHSLQVTECAREWVVMGTRSRVTTFNLQDGELLTVRLEAAVAWTTKPPTSFLPKLRLRDILTPQARGKNMMFHFYGPGIVWTEGSNAS